LLPLEKKIKFLPSGRKSESAPATRICSTSQREKPEPAAITLALTWTIRNIQGMETITFFKKKIQLRILLIDTVQLRVLLIDPVL
jgi:hypothetical protein